MPAASAGVPDVRAATTKASAAAPSSTAIFWPESA